MRVRKVSPVSGSVSEHKLSDIVREVKHVRRVRLDSSDSPEPINSPVQRKSPDSRWTDCTSPSLVKILEV